MSEQAARAPLTRGQKTGGTIAVAGALLAAATPSLMGFLGRWEGEAQYVVYADKLAGGIPTVCKGLTRHITSTPIVVGERWTPEKCEAEEQAAVRKVQQQLAPCLRVQVSQNTLDALSSHAWNFGASSTCASRAVALINQGKLQAGCDAMAHSPEGAPAWSYSGGKFYRGLYNRRLSERGWCVKP